MNHCLKILVLFLLTSLVCACAGFFDKDNTPTPSPLVKFTPEATVQTVWNVHPNNGTSKEYLKLVAASDGALIFTADKNGTVTATDKDTGKKRWSVRTGVAITGGAAAGEGLVIVGSKEGDVIALHQLEGSLAWKSKAPSEVFAPAAIGNGLILIKAIDGKLTAFAADNGQVRWQYQQTEPNLILRSASAPSIHHDTVVAGFANGNIVQLALRGGNLLWEQPLATAEGSFAIQRMIDIDADPIVVNDRVYAATYQGRVAALELNSGQTVWTHDLSSYTGLAADGNLIYVTDADSNLWAFEKNSGRVHWRQSQLLARNITGPVVMGPYIVVGDGEGYVHWLSKEDGHTVARALFNKSGILATPIVVNSVLYVLAKDGHLAAYRAR